MRKTAYSQGAYGQPGVLITQYYMRSRLDTEQHSTQTKGHPGEGREGGRTVGRMH